MPDHPRRHALAAPSCSPALSARADGLASAAVRGDEKCDLDLDIYFRSRGKSAFGNLNLRRQAGTEDARHRGQRCVAYRRHRPDVERSRAWAENLVGSNRGRRASVESGRHNQTSARRATQRTFNSSWWACLLAWWSAAASEHHARHRDQRSARIGIRRALAPSAGTTLPVLIERLYFDLRR